MWILKYSIHLTYNWTFGKDETRQTGRKPQRQIVIKIQAIKLSKGTCKVSKSTEGVLSVYSTLMNAVGTCDLM